MTRVVFYLLSVVVVAAAALVVPMPLAEIVPGGAKEIPELVEIGGEVETTPINGEVSLLTIVLRQPALVDSVAAWLSPSRDLQPATSVIPPGIERREYFRLQRIEFERAFELAAAVGLEAAGYEVTVTDAPVVFGVQPDGPSDGVLRTGDVIVTLEGRRVSSAEDLIDQLADVTVGQELELGIRRGSERLDVTVTADAVTGLDRPGLGVQVRTVGGDIELPFPVELRDSNIGGPSAGLMTAITVYDLLVDDDLIAGRTVVGTGTIDADGRVGAIGGLPEKVAAARGAGADLMLYPQVQAAELDGVDPGDVELVGVDDFDGALAALRGDRPG